MKKLHEDVAITDPVLAQQYANGQTQLITLDKKINALQLQVNKLETQKNVINNAMVKISQKQANEKPEDNANNQTPAAKEDIATKTADAAAAAAVAAQQATSESLVESIDISTDEEGRINQEIDQLADQVVYLQEHGGDPEEIDELINHINNLQDQLKDLDMDQMEHESLYDLDDEYGDGGPEFDRDDEHGDAGPEFDRDDEHGDGGSMYEAEEVRFSNHPGVRYEYNAQGKPIRRIDPTKQPKKRPWSDAKWQKYDNIEKEIEELQEEIDALEQEIKYQMERFQSPDFEGAEGEMEEFFGEIGFEASDILNSGGTDKEKLKALTKLGVRDPEGTLENYYYYYPEFDPKLEKPKKEAEKEVKKLQAQIDKIQKKKEAKQEKYDTFESYNPMSADKFYTLSEAYIEMEDEEEKKTSKEDYLDEDYVFYVKINDDDNEFIGKIFKISPDGDWFGIVKKGDDDSFEKISYEPEYDEIDIVDFLGDNYDTVEIIDRQEFNDYIEDIEEIDEDIIGGSNWSSNSVASAGPKPRY